jgi:eukaryotic-like serine/threonine-protein kinase
MSDVAGWARIQEVFHAALEMPDAGREAWLRQVAADDMALHAEVRSLLAAHDAEDLLGTPVEAPRTPRLFGLESDTIGPYRILRPLGQGGMGMVFLAAHEEHGISRTLALKLLRRDFEVPRLLERFSAERRILGRLEHPGIARLISAGATASGQPYFAMEFVEGTDLVHYCRERQADTATRLQLFLHVCDAVEYAHQQLVVHRDLKPGNILVTADGRPKLLDFGIAKLLDHDDDTGTRTRTGPWFTPEYASPEQVRGEPVSTQSDVYALGVILYELLTGSRPFDLRGLSPAALEQVVTTNVPDRPSARAGDARLSRALQGDLDTIVLKALAKEPSRRYAGVRDLADDVRRHLAHEPVRARPYSWPYRASRFVQRHRLGVSTAAIVTISLVGTLAAVSWQAAVAARERDRAERALVESQDVSRFLAELFQAADPARMAGDTVAARAILRRGVATVEQLANQPLVQARMLDALGMVFVNLGEYERAREFLARALALRQRHLGAQDQDVGESLRHMGRVFRALSRYAEAESVYLAALDMFRSTRGERSLEVAGTLEDLGFLEPYLGRPRESTAYYRQALALQREIHGDRHTDVANVTLLLGLSLWRQGANRDALGLVQEAVMRYQRDAAPDDPRTGTAMFHLADLTVAITGDTVEAERLYREGLRIRRRTRGRLDTGSSHGRGSLASLLSARGEHAQAESLYHEVLDVALAVVGPEAPDIAAAMEALADELGRQHRYDEALPLQRRALAMWRRMVGPEHAAVASNMSGLADLLLEHGDYAEARTTLQETIAMRIRLNGARHPLVGSGYSALGEVLFREKRYQEAEVALQQALTILRSQLRDEQADVVITFRRLAAVCDAQGRRDEGARYRQLADAGSALARTPARVR